MQHDAVVPDNLYLEDEGVEGDEGDGGDGGDGGESNDCYFTGNVDDHDLDQGEEQDQDIIFGSDIGSAVADADDGNPPTSAIESDGGEEAEVVEATSNYDDMGFSLIFDVSDGRASKTISDIQEFMLRRLTGSRGARVGRKGQSMETAFHVAAYALRHNLSLKQTDELLALMAISHEVDRRRIESIARDHFSSTAAYTTASALLKATLRDDARLFAPVEWTWSLGSDFFGEALGTKPIHLSCVNVSRLLAQLLLQVENPSTDFIIKSRHLYNGRNQRVYQDFFSADLAPMLEKKILDDFGEGYYLMPIAVSWDKAQANKSGSVVKCPGLLYVYNFAQSVMEPHFFGYIPTSLPFPESELDACLQANGVTTKKDRAFLINRAKERFINEYIRRALDPIVQLQSTGFVARVGQGFRMIARRFVPAFVGVLQDTAETASVCGVSPASSFMACRQCEACGREAIQNFTLEAQPRRMALDLQLLRDLARAEEDVIRLKMQGVTTGNALKAKIELVKGFRSDSKQRGHKEIPANVHIFELFDWNVHRGIPIHTLYDGIPADVLHTAGKGFIEHTIGHVLQLIMQVGILDPKKYGNNMSKLDSLIKTFPIYNSGKLTRHTSEDYHVRFRKGIFHHVNKTMSMTKLLRRNTGVLVSAGLETWKMYDLFVQLLFCIGGDAGDILPSEHDWLTDSKLGFPFSADYEDKATFSVHGCVVRAMASILEMYWYIKKESKTVDGQMITLEKLIANARARIAQIFHLKNKLLRCQTLKQRGRQHDDEDEEVDTDKDEAPEYEKGDNGMKNHYISHYPQNIARFGAATGNFDTEGTERLHKKYAAQVYEMTNKHASCSDRDMMAAVQKIDTLEWNARLEGCYGFFDVKAARSSVEEDAELAVFELDGQIREELHAKVANSARIHYLDRDDAGKFRLRSKTMHAKKISLVHPMLGESSAVAYLSLRREMLSDFRHVALVASVGFDGRDAEGNKINRFLARALVNNDEDSRRGSLTQFNFVSVKYFDEASQQAQSEVGAVMAIVHAWNDNDDREHNFVLIAWMKSVPRKSRDPFPYERKQFLLNPPTADSVNTRFYLDLIPSDHVFEPAYLITTRKKISEGRTLASSPLSMDFPYYRIPVERPLFSGAWSIYEETDFFCVSPSRVYGNEPLLQPQDDTVIAYDAYHRKRYGEVFMSDSQIRNVWADIRKPLPLGAQSRVGDR